MLRALDRFLLAIARFLRNMISELPGGCAFLAWFDPHHIATRNLREAMQSQSARLCGLALDIGCGAQPYATFFPGIRRMVGLDLPPTQTADILGDGQRLPFHDQCFDSVISNEVLEHVPRPADFLAEAARVLKPGGVLVLTTPQTWGLHAEPFDFYRYTRHGLRHLAESNGLEVIEIRPTCGLWATLVQRAADTVYYLFAARLPLGFRKLLLLLTAPLLLCGWLLDALFGHRGDTLDNLLVARRPD